MGARLRTTGSVIRIGRSSLEIPREVPLAKGTQVGHESVDGDCPSEGGLEAESSPRYVGWEEGRQNKSRKDGRVDAELHQGHGARGGQLCLDILAGSPKNNLRKFTVFYNTFPIFYSIQEMIQKMVSAARSIILKI